jgi:hypothetical protein
MTIKRMKTKFYTKIIWTQKPSGEIKNKIQSEK